MVILYIGLFAFCIFSGNVEADEKPCTQLAGIVGNVIDFVRYDWHIQEIAEGHLDEALEQVSTHVKEYTRDEVDFWSPEDREEFICNVLSAKKFDDIWSLVKTEKLPKEATHDIACYYYQYGMYLARAHHVLNISTWESVHDFFENLGHWMIYSGFPETWPIAGEHAENVEKLQELRDFLVSDDPLQGEMHSILPIGTIHGYNSETYEYTPRFYDLDELVTLMEGSKNIFQYIGTLAEDEDLYFSLSYVSHGTNWMELWKYNYEKVQWLIDGFKIVLKTDLFNLDVSSCALKFESDDLPIY